MCIKDKPEADGSFLIEIFKNPKLVCTLNEIDPDHHDVRDYVDEILPNRWVGLSGSVQYLTVFTRPHVTGLSFYRNTSKVRFLSCKIGHSR